MSQTTFCKRHKTVETNISCGRCGDSICPRCIVHAPVGVRCPDCGRSRPTPTFDVSPMFMIRGIGAGVVVGLLGGVVIAVIVVNFYILPRPVHLIAPYLPGLLIAGLGYLIGETVSRATNRKRGPRLKLVAGLCMLVGYSLVAFLTGGTIVNTLYLLAGAAGFYLAIRRF